MRTQERKRRSLLRSIVAARARWFRFECAVALVPVCLGVFAGARATAAVPQSSCLPCHEKQVTGAQANRMTRALSPAESTAVPAADETLNFDEGRYRYRVRREGNRVVYQVSDGEQSLSVPLKWAFGAGHTGITWVFDRGGVWVESRVSYYPSLRGLHLTVGAANEAPASLEAAAGRVMTASDSRECFGCHTTKGPGLTAFVDGVQCEGCHGSGSRHKQALAQGAGKGIDNPGRGTTEEISNFCGRCHRSWEQVQLMRIRGISTIRFQPYRLTNSRCYDAEDRRISCVACHDPHGALVTSPAAYDPKCLACHSTGKTCPRASSNCVECHMPKYELPGAHAKFTDHQIRIVRLGESFPN